jgi:hypothetical protein
LKPCSTRPTKFIFSFHFGSTSTNMDFPGTYFAEAGWKTYERLKTIHVPVLLMHGGADDLIRPIHMQINYDAANQPKQQHLEPTGGHSNLPVVMGQRFADLVDGFVMPQLAVTP